MNYRLLNFKEKIQQDDEVLIDGNWQQVSSLLIDTCVALRDVGLFRRLDASVAKLGETPQT